MVWILVRKLVASEVSQSLKAHPKIEVDGLEMDLILRKCPQVKNLKRYFTFEVTIMDDKQVRRRFRASNYQSETRVKDSICTMPMRLDDGWNQIQFNLAEFTKRAYGQSASRQSLCNCCQLLIDLAVYITNPLSR